MRALEFAAAPMLSTIGDTSIPRDIARRKPSPTFGPNRASRRSIRARRCVVSRRSNRSLNVSVLSSKLHQSSSKGRRHRSRLLMCDRSRAGQWCCAVTATSSPTSSATSRSAAAVSKVAVVPKLRPGSWTTQPNVLRREPISRSRIRVYPSNDLRRTFPRPLPRQRSGQAKRGLSMLGHGIHE